MSRAGPSGALCKLAWGSLPRTLPALRETSPSSLFPERVRVESRICFASFRCFGLSLQGFFIMTAFSRRRYEK